MKHILYLLLFLLNLTVPVHAQELNVTYVKNATLKNGQSIKANRPMTVQQTIMVLDKGILILENETGWSFRLTTGIYDLDSCYRYYKNVYSGYDSTKALIHEVFPEGLRSCKYSPACLTDAYSLDRQQLNYEHGNIAFCGTAKDELTVTSDTITIHWRDPKKSTGRYFIEVENIFEEIIDYKIAYTTQCYFNLKQYYLAANLKYLFIRVTSEDCTVSSKLFIKQE